MKIRIAVRIFAILLLLGLFRVALADQTIGGGSGLVDPLKGCNLACLAKKITGLLFTISIPITSIMVLVGGFQMMTAGGDPEKFSKGKKTILYAAAGFVVVLFADQMVNVLQKLFGG